MEAPKSKIKFDFSEIIVLVQKNLISFLITFRILINGLVFTRSMLSTSTTLINKIYMHPKLTPNSLHYKRILTVGLIR